MARYRRYYRRVVRAAKKKWASNTMEIQISASTVGANGFTAIGQYVLQNGDRVNAAAAGVKSTAQILKSSRIRFRGVISEASNIVGLSLLYFITYVPEGANALVTGNGNNSDLGNYGFYTHPEWVMAWGRKDFIGASQSNELSLTTKLKRNLNSGDSILFVACWINRNTSSASVSSIVGTVSYMCCAN